MHYLGVFLEDDSAMSKTLECSVAGKFLNGWWDSCSDAGSQRRPRNSFSEPIPSLEVLVVGDDSKCKNLVVNLQHCFLSDM